MWALLKLQFKTYFKNPSSIMPYILGIMFIAIYGSIDTINFTTSIGNVVTLSMMSGALMGFGFRMFEMRRSVIMKRIGSTSISKFGAMMSFFTFTMIVSLFNFGWIMLWTYVFSATGYAHMDWGSVNWGGVFYGLFTGLIMSLAISFFFVSISPTVEVFNSIMQIYWFLASFVGGIMLPGASAEWMTWIGYFIPHTYITRFMGNAFSGGNVFAITTGINFDVMSPMPMNIINADDNLINILKVYEGKDISPEIDGLKDLPIWADLAKLDYEPRLYVNRVDTDLKIVSLNPYQNISQLIHPNPVTYTNLNIWVPWGATLIASAGSVKRFKWDV